MSEDIDTVWFWDGNKQCFLRIPRDKVLELVSAEDFLVAGIVATHRMYAEELVNVLDETPGTNPTPADNEAALSTKLDKVKIKKP